MGLIIILLSILITDTANAEDSVRLFGYVKDLDGVPLANSWIGVSNERHEYLGGDTSNAEGLYEFFVEESGTYYLRAQHNSLSDPFLFDYIHQDKLLL